MQVTKEIVSVSEMARMLGFSRARFYQLVRQGILPKPESSEHGKRPYYSRQQQERCIEVRKTHRGINGQPILFYAMRPQMTTSVRRVKSKPVRKSVPGRGEPPLRRETAVIQDIRHALSQLGLDAVSDRSILDTLADAFPDGVRDTNQGELLQAVFSRLNRQNPPDNVT